MGRGSSEIVTTLLRQTDKQIKEQKYQLALESIDKLLSIDPKNIYAHAFKERINALQEEEKRTAKVKRETAAKVNESKPHHPVNIQAVAEPVKLSKKNEHVAAEPPAKHQHPAAKEKPAFDHGHSKKPALPKAQEPSVQTDPVPVIQKQPEVHIHLSKADVFFQQNRYDDALTELTYAFLVDPFNEEITRREKAILAKQQNALTAEHEQSLPSVHSAPQQTPVSAERSPVNLHNQKEQPAEEQLPSTVRPSIPKGISNKNNQTGTAPLRADNTDTAPKTEVEGHLDNAWQMQKTGNYESALQEAARALKMAREKRNFCVK